MKNNEPNILLFTLHYPTVTFAAFGQQESGAMKQGGEVRSLLSGADGIAKPLKELQSKDYGRDLEHVMINIHINPIDYELDAIQAVGAYSKKNRTIEVALVVADAFFRLAPEERRAWLMSEILDRLHQIADIARRQKWNTDCEQLIADVEARM